MSVLMALQLRLRAILLALPGIPQVIQYEGQGIDPPTGLAWLTEHMSLVSSVPASYGWDGETEERLLYTLGLRWPAAKVADLSGKRMADRIRMAFWSGRDVSPASSDIRAHVLSSEVASALPGTGWTHYPITITLLARRPTLYHRAQGA